MNKAIQIALLAAMSTAEQQFELETQDSCLALALNGGGSKGSYQAGVIWGWTHYGNPDDFRYDVLSGISVGSVNAIALVGWKIGDELKAAQWISDMWKDLNNSDVWAEWTLGIVSGLFI